MNNLVHFTAPYFLNPVHPISVILVGVGGNGSQMLSVLARINHALLQLGHPGLVVHAYDGDVVEPSNVGRQLFSACDVGLNKAECLITRFNRFYGTSWTASPSHYKADKAANIIISCVDNIKTRIEIAKLVNLASKGKVSKNENDLFYWLDLGNAQRTGQIVLGSTEVEQPKSTQYIPLAHLKSIAEMFDLGAVDEKDSGPSCSLAEALSKQDLFINSTLAQLGGSLLWSLLRDNIITTQGMYVNLDSFKVMPIPLQE